MQMAPMIPVPRDVTAQAHKVRSTVARITPALGFVTTTVGLAHTVSDIDTAIADLRRLRFSVRAMEAGL